MNWHYVRYSLLGVAVVVVAFLWHRSEIANARAEERSKAQDQIIKAAQDAKDAADQKAKQANDDLERQKQKPATVQVVTKYLPAPLPEGSELRIEQLPDEPVPQVVLSGDAQKNLDAIRDMELAHHECDNNLAACTEKLKQAEIQAGAAEQKADQWKQAAQGKKTGFWNRVKLAASCTWKPALGAAIGLGIGAATGKKNGSPIGAAVGAGVGGMACTF